MHICISYISYTIKCRVSTATELHLWFDVWAPLAVLSGEVSIL